MSFAVVDSRIDPISSSKPRGGERTAEEEEAEGLPYSDGIPMESQLHRELMVLLIDTIRSWLGDRGYAGGNMFVYYRPASGPTPGPASRSTHGRRVAHRNCGPDVFVALDVEPRVRKKWVSWMEGKVPDVAIEFLSDSTRNYDRDAKKKMYQDSVRVPEYYWFDPQPPHAFAGFALRDGVYVPLEPNSHGRLTSERLGGLQLGPWRGDYKGVESTWLRWYSAQGVLLPTSEEIQTARADAEQQRADAAEQRADAEQQRADAEQQRADRERQRAAALVRKLRSLGIEPDAS